MLGRMLMGGKQRIADGHCANILKTPPPSHHFMAQKFCLKNGRAAARSHIKGSVSPWRIVLSETEPVKDGPRSVHSGASVLGVMLCRKLKGGASSERAAG